MNKTQWIVISSAIVLFLVMYFGCDTKPDTHEVIEKQRALSAVSTDISALLMDAKSVLVAKEGSTVLSLEAELNNATQPVEKAAIYEQLSSTWYKLGKPAIAGYYAEQVAENRKTEDAWSIAGTTYSICVQRETEDKVKSFCTERAIHSLENATSLNPDNVQHKVNLALVYTENPPAENPMKGILMLVELNKQNPESIPVLNQLGRLAIKTGQFSKAVERLGKAVEVEPDNMMSNCLLGKAYEGLGENEKAAPYLTKCEKLTLN